MSSGVMVADMMEGMRFALGPAMAVRRDAIDAIGGIRAVADYYSDDFELGNRIWAKNYKVRSLAPYRPQRPNLSFPAPHARRSAAMDEEHALLASCRSCGHRPHLRDALRHSGPDFCRRTRSLDAWSCSTRVSLLEPHDSISDRRLDGSSRPSSSNVLLALSVQGSFWFHRLGHQLLQQRLLLARRNLPLRPRRKNRPPATTATVAPPSSRE